MRHHGQQARSSVRYTAADSEMRLGSTISGRCATTLRTIAHPNMHVADYLRHELVAQEDLRLILLSLLALVRQPRTY
jgi:hypothetical protein